MNSKRNDVKPIQIMLIVACIAFAPAHAQTENQDGCKFVGAFLGALLGQNINPCKNPENPQPPVQATPPTSGAGGSKQVGGVQYETKEWYLERLVESAREYYEVEPGPEVKRYSAKPGFYEIPLQCEKKAIEQRWPELNYFRMERAGLDPSILSIDRLQEECTQRADIYMQRFFEKRNEIFKREAAEKEAAKKAEEERIALEQETERKRKQAQLIADLRSGRKAPESCLQYMVSKGYSLEETEGYNTSIMFPALTPPKGNGMFMGTIGSLENRQIYLRGEFTRDSLVFGKRRITGLPDNSYIILTEGTKIINGEKIRVGSQVIGVGTQQRTQSAKLVTGAGTTVAVVQALCIEAG